MTPSELFQQFPDGRLPIDQSRLAGIRGDVGLDQGEHLAFMAALCQPEDVVLEVGSLRGLSSSYLGLGAESGGGAMVYCVDPWDLRCVSDSRSKPPYWNPKGAKKWRYNIRQAGLSGRLVQVQAYSGQIAKVWYRPLGALFIDGDHTYKGCLIDYLGFGPYVVPGAIMAVHDYRHKSYPRLGLNKVVDEIIRPSGLWEDERRFGSMVSWRRNERPWMEEGAK